MTDDASTARVHCPHCGKGYRFREDFADRPMRCKACDATFHMPATADEPAMLLTAPPVEDAADDAAENLDDPELFPDQAIPEAHAESEPSDAAAPVELPPGVGFTRSDFTRQAEQEAMYRQQRWKDWHAPIAMLAFCLVVITPVLFAILLLSGNSWLRSFGGTLMILAGQLIVGLPVMFVSIWVVSVIMQIGFGALTTTLLKLAGIALGPGMIGDLIMLPLVPVLAIFGGWGVMIGTAVAFFVYLALIGAPMAFMFDLDGLETVVTTVVVIFAKMFMLCTVIAFLSPLIM